MSNDSNEGRTIFRTQHSDCFACIPNETLRDRRLSFRARGVLAMVLTHRTDWEVSRGWLESHGTEGREAVKSALDELRALGYCKLESNKRPDGRFSWIWTFYDVPMAPDVVTNDGFPASATRHRLPADGNPSFQVQNTITENHQRKKRSVGFGDAVQIPEVLAGSPQFQTAWQEWLEDRRARRKPVTVKAAKSQLALLAGFGLDKALKSIADSIQNGWTGLFEPKERNETDSKSRQHRGRFTADRNQGTCNRPEAYANWKPKGD